MGWGLDRYREFCEGIDAQDDWFWEENEPVAFGDRVLFFATQLFMQFMDAGPSASEGIVKHMDNAEDALRGGATNDPKTGLLQGVQAGSPQLRMAALWPRILRPLPNPSGIVWGYSDARNDYAGALGEGGRVLIIPFPQQLNEVLWYLASSEDPLPSNN